MTRELKGKIQFELEKIKIFNDRDLETFLRNDEYRTVSNNGPQTQFCDLCDDDEEVGAHKMII